MTYWDDRDRWAEGSYQYYGDEDQEYDKDPEPREWDYNEKDSPLRPHFTSECSGYASKPKSKPKEASPKPEPMAKPQAKAKTKSKSKSKSRAKSKSKARSKANLKPNSSNSNEAAEPSANDSNIEIIMLDN